jgi:hypothetical protein
VVSSDISFDLSNDENLPFDLHEYRWSRHRHSNGGESSQETRIFSSTPPRARHPVTSSDLAVLILYKNLHFLNPGAVADSIERTREPTHFQL